MLRTVKKRCLSGKQAGMEVTERDAGRGRNQIRNLAGNNLGWCCRCLQMSGKKQVSNEYGRDASDDICYEAAYNCVPGVPYPDRAEVYCKDIKDRVG